MARLHQKDGGMNEKNKRAAADPAMPPEGKKQKVHEDVADTGEAVQKMKPAEPTFLGIPRELRDEICKLVIGRHVVNFHNIRPYAWFRLYLGGAAYNGCRKDAEKQWDEMFNLSLVCHQLNVETKDLPYKLGFFETDSVSDLGDLMRRMKTDKKRLITTIVFDMVGKFFYSIGDIEVFMVQNGLYYCTGLRTIIASNWVRPSQTHLLKTFAALIGAKLLYDEEVPEYMSYWSSVRQMENYWDMLEESTDEKASDNDEESITGEEESTTDETTGPDNEADG